VDGRRPRLLRDESGWRPSPCTSKTPKRHRPNQSFLWAADSPATAGLVCPI